MADVTYAEPTRLNDFKPNPFLNIPKAPPELQQNSANTTSTLTISTKSSNIYAQPHNLPPRQTNLRNDGNWNTIDLTPKNRGVDTVYAQRGQRYDSQVWSIKNNGTAGLTAGQSYSRDQAFAELAYNGGFLIDGLLDGFQGKNVANEQLRFKRSGTEDLSYGLGQKVGDELRNITKDATDGLKRTREELWKNRPRFEIPEFKIPEWDIEFPEIPPFPKPNPIPPPRPQPKPTSKPTSKPKTLSDKIRDMDLSKCGGGTVSVAFVGKSKSNDDGSLGFEQSSIDEFFSVWKVRFPDEDRTNEEILTSFGGGNFPQLIEDNGISYALIVGGDVKLNIDGSSGELQFPYYQVYTQTALFNEGVKPGAILNSLDANLGLSIKGEAFDFRTAESDKVGCYIPEPYPDKSPPPEPPPPEPPPKKECCRMSCCPKSPSIDYRAIKKLMVQTIKEQTFALDIPITSCKFNEETNKWEPKTSYTIIEVFATNINQARQSAQLHIENAEQAADLCLARNQQEQECNAIASLPERYQIPVDGHIPQLICLFREVKEDGSLGDDYYPITMPHPASDQQPNTNNPPLPTYKKGSWEGILTLKDNSKAFVNAETKEEAERMLEAIKAKTHTDFLVGSFQKIGQRKGQALKEINVKLFRCDYYPTGTKNAKPQWIKYFRGTSS
ncbi:hypothetical protein NIES21_27220 [Anabaenopsis circularis NIES-21]|uniref:Uncharacterized protein n=1 Tax=Anabaenopsis circularis NIES-21 TaxID=1085406 RepID=A0A1Z4GHM2_9CYAN|nr:hypothetical protein NIES21_27220 [Anabaenopsis circularis NIES-21]